MSAANYAAAHALVAARPALAGIGISLAVELARWSV